MTVTYLLKGAKHTDNDAVIENVIKITQEENGVAVDYTDGRWQNTEFKVGKLF